ncbi:MAG: T9SS type A sorting domain-containing protein [Bacteroidetes bacterium]|nr:T9SS type A sorting domain-containing protein [Bacteroidota bacterium]
MGRDILIDTNGSVYTTGYFMGTADFNPGNGTYGLTAIGGWDAFIAILDSFGNFTNAKAFGGSADDSGNTLELDGLGNLYLTGGFKNTVDFDPGGGSFPLTSSGLQDVFMSKYDSAGNFIWAKIMGGIGFDVGIAMALGSAFDIYLTGTFSGTADFNPPYLANLYSNGNEDLFVAKYNQSLLGIGENSSDKSFAIYPNPTNTFFTVQLPEIIVRVAIEFTELNGRVIRKATVNNTDTLSIYVGDLAEGVYLVKVVGEERSYFKRVIIIRD